MKKLLSILLAVVMIVGMIPMSIIPAYAAELPTVEIGTGNELVAFIKNVNNGAYPDGVNAKLTADIDISMTEGLSGFDGVGYDDGYGYFNLTTPIGRDENHPFKGIFDGQGHYIEFWFDTDINYFESYGLFGVNYGTIKNLTVGLEGADFFYFWGNNPRLNVGGLCATNYGTIENCVNRTNLIADRNAGGICATNYGTVDGCVNYGQVNGYYRAGGIVGTSSGTVINCMNYGHLVADSDEDNTGTGDYANYTGGIVGELDGGKVYNCANYGTIEQSRYGTPAGIIGRTDSGEISACFVGGTVTGKNAHTVIGRNDGATITSVYYEIKDGFPADDNAEGIEKSLIDSGYAVSLLREAAKNIAGAKTWYIGADGYPAFVGSDVPHFLTPSISCTVDGNGVVTVVGTGNIPANAFANDTTIKQVILGEGITSIGANAFAGCANLHKITVKGQNITFENVAISGITGADAFTVEKADGTKADIIGNASYNSLSGSIKAVYIHRFDKARDVVTAPTCTAEGYTTHYCRDCDYSYTDTVTKAAGHHYTQKRLANKVVAPTCTKKGSITHYCDNCKYSYTEKTAATGHIFDKNGKCTKCAAVYSANHAGSETVHFEGAKQIFLKIVYNAPSSSAFPIRIDSEKSNINEYAWGGNTKQFTLDGEWVSGNIFFDENLTVFVFPIYSENAVTVEPTCTNEGCKGYTYGGEIYPIETIAATGHFFDKNGKCTRCSKDYSTMAFGQSETIHFEGAKQIYFLIEGNYAYNTTNHNNILMGNDYNQTFDLTGGTQKQFVIDGDWLSYSLSRDFSRTIVIIPFYGDNKSTVEPTCTEDGYTEISYCGETYKMDILPAAGHYFDKNGKCTKCSQGYSTMTYGQSGTIHFEGAKQVVLTITCNSPSGSMTSTQNILQGKNHSEQIVLVGGTKKFYRVDGDWLKYTVNHDIDKFTVEAYPVYDDNETTVQPTCTTDGYSEVYYCGKTYRETLPATGHPLDKNWKCTMCGEAFSFDDFSIGYPEYDKTIVFRDADSITVKFKAFNNSNFLRVYDGSGNEVAMASCYWNNLTDNAVTVSGNTVRITCFESMGSFEIESITPNYPEGYEPPLAESNDPSSVGSTLSDGNLWIILVVAVLAIGSVAALVIVKKKKKPADEIHNS